MEGYDFGGDGVCLLRFVVLLTGEMGLLKVNNTWSLLFSSFRMPGNKIFMVVSTTLNNKQKDHFPDNKFT